jgi:hypothetical protein
LKRRLRAASTPASEEAQMSNEREHGPGPRGGQSAHPTINASHDERHDFDFIFGRWRVHSRKLIDVTDPACEEWVEFTASSEAFAVLDGLGHVDRMYVDDSPEAGHFEGFTLRLYNPSSGTWRIWWSSTRAPGILDPPVEGRFSDRQGIFECEDEIAGHRVDIRFEWLVEDPDSPRWQQSFSYDAGETWKLNWTMTLTRI